MWKVHYSAAVAKIAASLPEFIVVALLIATIAHGPELRASPSVGARATDRSLSQPWVKRGLVISPDFAGPAYAQFASGPSVIRLKDGSLRMYFWAICNQPSHDECNVFLAAESAPGNPFKWSLISSKPLLGTDSRKNIRDKGVALPFVVPRDDGPWLMYYSALGSLDLEPGVRRSARTGLAVSHDEGISWEVFKETVLPTGNPGTYDASLTGSVAVLRTGSHNYTMWYTAGEKYVNFGQYKRGIVHLGLASSTDGVSWQKFREPALRARLNAVDPYEAVVSKPAVLKLDGIYHMWLNSFRMDVLGYRIEYAWSTDGIHWHRNADRPVLPLTPGGFDSRNQSYPSVIDMGDQLWMFYVGDDFGSTGIGLATMDKSALQSGLKAD